MNAPLLPLVHATGGEGSDSQMPAWCHNPAAMDIAVSSPSSALAGAFSRKGRRHGSKLRLATAAFVYPFSSLRIPPTTA